MPTTSIEWAQWLQAIGTMTAVIAALLIALFQDRMRAWLLRPKLHVSIEVKPPDCLKIPMSRYSRNGELSAFADNYYFRLRVSNKGNHKADLVEVFAARLLKRLVDDTYKEVEAFLPMNLLWADYRKEFIPAISPNMYRYCDLAHIIDPIKREEFAAENKNWVNVPHEETILSFDTAVKSNSLCHLHPAGKYRLVILVAAANSKPIETILEISLSGVWYDDEQKMFGEGIGIRVL